MRTWKLWSMTKSGPIPERFKLVYLHISSGTSIVPTATVKLAIDNMEFEAAATGDGPVDAACHAVDKITDIYGKMHDYKLNAVSSGKDALGEVISHIEIDGKIYGGRGLSTILLKPVSNPILMLSINTTMRNTSRQVRPKGLLSAKRGVIATWV